MALLSRDRYDQFRRRSGLVRRRLDGSLGEDPVLLLSQAQQPHLRPAARQPSAWLPLSAASPAATIAARSSSGSASSLARITSSSPAALVAASPGDITGRVGGPLTGASLSLGSVSPTAGLSTNRILLRLSSATLLTELQAALRRLGGTLQERIQTTLMRELGQGPVLAVSLPAGLTMERALRLYRRLPGVELAEPEWVVISQATSNDFYYTANRLWGMNSSDTPTAAGPEGTTNGFGSQAEQAWELGFTGSTKMVVGVVDQGIDYTHEDLYLNIWLNQAEIRDLAFFPSLIDVNSDGLINFRDLNDERNGAFVTDLNANARIDAGDLLKDRRWADRNDNDGNGYKDDLIGWDFIRNSNDPYPSASAVNHGTHVAGTIGAVGGNGLGVAGVNWAVQLMPLRFLRAGLQGRGVIFSAINALNYYAGIAARQDVYFGGSARFVGTNNSWKSTGSSIALREAVLNVAKVGSLFVAAAGNGGGDRLGDNNDLLPTYPASYTTDAELGWDAVVSVAAINELGALAGFSNWGPSTVDLAAPGVNIMSSLPGGYGQGVYDEIRNVLQGVGTGTSMATPHVTGALALMAATFPQASPQQLLAALAEGAAATPSLAGRTLTGGRLDVASSLAQLAADLAAVASAPPEPSRTIWGTSRGDYLIWNAGGGTGPDRITGVAPTGSLPRDLGSGQVDRVNGGAGADLFLLADNRGIFYNDGRNGAGLADYLWIVDFDPGQDKVQLLSNRQYLIRDVTIDGTPFSELYLGNGNPALDDGDELIARLQGIALAGGLDVSVLDSEPWLSFL